MYVGNEQYTVWITIIFSSYQSREIRQVGAAHGFINNRGTALVWVERLWPKQP